MTMILRHAVTVTVVAAVSMGCSGPASRPKVQIGAIASVTGDLANVGQAQLDGIELAVSEINTAGGVNGADLDVVNKDDASDATGAANAADALVALKVPVVIGAVGSGKTLAAAPKLYGAQIAMISPSSTSPEITSLQDNGYVFRTCASDALQGKLLAKRARAKPFSKVAVIYIPDPYGTGLASAFAADFTAAGGTVTFNQSYTEGQQSYMALLTQAYAQNPEAILLVAYAVDGAQIINDYLASFASKNTFFYFTDGLEDPAFVSAVGASKFSSLSHEGTGPATLTGAAEMGYQDRYKARFNHDLSPGSYSESAYDAVFLAALAMAAGGENTAKAVHDNITAVSAGGKKVTRDDLKGALDAAKAKTDIDFDGVSGNVDLDANGDVVAPYDVWKVTNGTFAVIESAVVP
jgi:ABC-type branched-subunit amino acid transport system substrate-binding protein